MRSWWLLAVLLLSLPHLGGCAMSIALQEQRQFKEQLGPFREVWINSDGDLLLLTFPAGNYRENEPRWVLLRFADIEPYVKAASVPWPHPDGRITTFPPWIPSRLVTLNPTSSEVADVEPAVFDQIIARIDLETTYEVVYRKPPYHCRIDKESLLQVNTSRSRSSPIGNALYTVFIVPAVVADVVTFPIQLYMFFAYPPF